MNEWREVSGTLSSLRAEYYYFPGHGECFRAGLRICWTITSINGSLFPRFVSWQFGIACELGAIFSAKSTF